MKKENNELLKIEEVGKMLPNPLPKSYASVRDFVIRHREIFKPIILGEGNGKRYYVPRENVTKFLKEHIWK